MDFLAFLLMLVPLVVIHEFGHFLVCKLGGIKVTQFCFGFGKRLFGFRYKGTDYRWNLLPLGGYVDFMGPEVIYFDRIPEDVTHFYNRPKWLRFLVLLMGPLFNLLLAFGLFWLIAFAKPVQTPIYKGDGLHVAYIVEESAEINAGLLPGDRILGYNGEVADSVDEFDKYVLINPNKPMTLTINRDGEERTIDYEIDVDPVEGIGKRNIVFDGPVAVRSIREGSPAQKAGLEIKDIILKINDVAIDWKAVSEGKQLETLAAKAPGQSTFVVARNGETLSFEITPELDDEGRWLVGMTFTQAFKEVDLDLGGSFKHAWGQCIEGSTLIYKMVKRLVFGQVSIKTLAGPVTMAKVAKQAIQRDLFTFLAIAAIISLNLGLLNLLPIPMLDGGEIFVLLIEWVSRKDFNLASKMKLKFVGFVFLAGLMSAVIVTDIWKLFQT